VKSVPTSRDAGTDKAMHQAMAWPIGADGRAWPQTSRQK
jgi:hypothetical protein